MRQSRVLVFAGVPIALLIGWLLLSPPRFWLNWTKSVQPAAAVGAQLVEQHGCRSCHKIAGEGALKAPNLDGIGQSEVDPAQITLRLWLRDPSAVKRDTAMPNFRLSDSEIEAILAYLKEADMRQ